MLALALLGDALLYLVLPVEAAAFGVSTAWVGVLLSANRFVRLGVNVLLVPAGRRIGLGGLALLGAVLATASTFGYALLAGGAALLVMRLGWGVGYSALRLSQLGFATEAGSGRRLGRSFALTQLGPLLAVTGGVYLVGAWGLRPAFAVLAALSAAAVGLAWGLPRHTAGGETEPALHGRELLPTPTRTDVTALLFTLATDGLFMVGLTPLLVHEGFGSDAAIQAGGVVLVVRRVAALVLGVPVGRLADRLGLVRLFRISLASVAAGLLAAAAGTAPAGLVATAGLIPVLQVLAPGVAALRSDGRRLHRLAAFATWSDLGAAAGALLAGSLLGLLDVRLLFTGAGILVAAGLALEYASASDRAPVTGTIRS